MGRSGMSCGGCVFVCWLNSARHALRTHQENVAIADARVEFKVHADVEAGLLRNKGAAQFLVDGRHQRPAVLRADVAGREVAHLLVLDVDQIATHRPVIGAEFQAHRGAFERRPTGVDD